VGAFRDLFADACAAMGVPATVRVFDADARLEAGDHPSRITHDLARFEPCGQSNAAPRVAIDDARVLGVREVRGGHLRLWVDVAGVSLSCFGAEMGPLAAALGPRARVVGALRPDTWNGGGAVEMRLVAAEPA
jgi:single-stranded-DNA-specific exonuclease